MTHSNAPLGALALLLALTSPLVQASPICHWVDNDGQKQLSDRVPEAYRRVAVCQDSQAFELSPKQQVDARQRAAQAQALRDLDRARADALPPEANANPTAGAALTAAPRARRPVEEITASTACPTQWRIYDESMACFSPFRTTQGAIKPEAYEQCREVGSPEVACGPRTD